VLEVVRRSILGVQRRDFHRMSPTGSSACSRITWSPTVWRSPSTARTAGAS
jgi:hypothetical protein